MSDNTKKLNYSATEINNLLSRDSLSDFTDDLGTSPTHTHSQYATINYVDSQVGDINTILQTIVGE